MSGGRTVRVAVAATAILAALILGIGAGAASADPAPVPEAPTTSDPVAPPTSDPAAPPADEAGDPSMEIKSGTAKQGTIHWEKFGGDSEEAPKTLDEFSKMLIGYSLTLFGFAAMISGLFVAILMALGFKGRSAVAKAALESSVWILIAVILVGSLSSIVGMLVVFADLV